MKATKLVYFRLFRFCFGLEICSKFEIEKFHFYFFSVSVRLNVVFFCSATHLHHLFGHAHSWISLYFLFTVLSTLVFVSMYSDSYSKKMTHNSINSRVEWSVRRFGAVDLFLVFSFTQPLSLSLSHFLHDRWLISANLLIVFILFVCLTLLPNRNSFFSLCWSRMLTIQ